MLASQVRSHVFIAWIIVLLGAVSGCGGTLGPVVMDVRWDSAGQLVVTRCMLDITSAMGITSFQMEQCKRTVQSSPSAAPVEQRSAPKNDSSATTVN